jgi:hypothetical protein
LVVGFTFFNSERIKENETKTVQTDSPQVQLKEIIPETHKSEQLIAKENSNSTVSEKRKVEKPAKKKPVVTETAKEESMLADAFIPKEEELPEVPENIENIIPQPNELAATMPENEIKIRVSLSPAKQKNEKGSKIEFKLNNSKLNDYENNTDYLAGTVIPFNLFR